jgi:integrase
MSFRLRVPGSIRQPLRSAAPLWLRLRVRAQISPRLRLYDATRHTFNSTAARLGVPREIRMRLMGHAPSREVHDVYTHYAPEFLLRAADLVAKELAVLLRGETEGIRQWTAAGEEQRRLVSGHDAPGWG